MKDLFSKIAIALVIAMCITSISPMAGYAKEKTTTKIVYVGDSYQVKEKNTDVCFVSSNKKVAKVNATTGKLTPQKTGKATIMVKNNNTGKVLTKRYYRVKVRQMTLSNGDDIPANLRVGESYTFKVDGKKAYFFSNNTDIVTIAKKTGKVSIKKTGNVTITAKNRKTGKRIVAKKISVVNKTTQQSNSVTDKAGEAITKTPDANSSVATQSITVTGEETTVRNASGADNSAAAQSITTTEVENIGKFTVSNKMIDLASASENHSLISEDDTAYFFYELFDENGKEISDYSDYKVLSSDESKCYITSFSNSGKTGRYVSIYGVGTGTVNLLITNTATMKTVKSFSVTLKANDAACNQLLLDKEFVSLPVLGESTDTRSFWYHVNDQYGNQIKYDVKKLTITPKSVPSGSEGVTLAKGQDGELIFSYSNQDMAVPGDYIYELTYDDLPTVEVTCKIVKAPQIGEYGFEVYQSEDAVDTNLEKVGGHEKVILQPMLTQGGIACKKLKVGENTLTDVDGYSTADVSLKLINSDGKDVSADYYADNALNVFQKTANIVNIMPSGVYKVRSSITLTKTDGTKEKYDTTKYITISNSTYMKLTRVKSSYNAKFDLGNPEKAAESLIDILNACYQFDVNGVLYGCGGKKIKMIGDYAILAYTNNSYAILNYVEIYVPDGDWMVPYIFDMMDCCTIVVGEDTTATSEQTENYTLRCSFGTEKPDFYSDDFEANYVIGKSSSTPLYLCADGYDQRKEFDYTRFKVLSSDTELIQFGEETSSDGSVQVTVYDNTGSVPIYILDQKTLDIVASYTVNLQKQEDGLISSLQFEDTELTKSTAVSAASTVSTKYHAYYASGREKTDYSDNQLKYVVLSQPKDANFSFLPEVNGNTVSFKTDNTTKKGVYKYKFAYDTAQPVIVTVTTETTSSSLELSIRLSQSQDTISNAVEGVQNKFVCYGAMIQDSNGTDVDILEANESQTSSWQVLGYKTLCYDVTVLNSAGEDVTQKVTQRNDSFEMFSKYPGCNPGDIVFDITNTDDDGVTSSVKADQYTVYQRVRGSKDSGYTWSVVQMKKSILNVTDTTTEYTIQRNAGEYDENAVLNTSERQIVNIDDILNTCYSIHINGRTYGKNGETIQGATATYKRYSQNCVVIDKIMLPNYIKGAKVITEIDVAKGANLLVPGIDIVIKDEKE